MRTADLMLHIERCITAPSHGRCYFNRVEEDGAATFIVSGWAHLRTEGATVKRIPRWDDAAVARRAPRLALVRSDEPAAPSFDYANFDARRWTP